LTNSKPHPMYAHIYVSPHLDDAALSCGGRIWQQAQAGDRVLVVTVFAGERGADSPLSPFAAQMHALWELEGDAPTMRRREDAEALACLGTDAAYWPYLDCIYRQMDDDFPYASEEALFGEVYPAEEKLVDELAGRLGGLPLEPGGTLYAPMAIGRHVDHQVVHRAAGRIGRPVAYYEDYPYAEDQQAVQEALEGLSWRVERVALSEEALEARVAAIARYDSQFITLGWADAAAMEKAVRAFAVRTGDGVPAERYWRPMT
jgi:LmbE family N-acetylglucosaminyl deacetylase